MTDIGWLTKTRVEQDEIVTEVAGRNVTITRPNQVLWPELGLTKLDYMRYLVEVSGYLLPYTRDRLLMRWRYPEGIHGEKIEEKAIPRFAPEWMPRAVYKEKVWILLNDLPTLVWLANVKALELHVPFDRYPHKDVPTELALDLDPPEEEPFELVREVALAAKEALDSLGLRSVPKLSGATGLQIYVPIANRYSFEEVRLVNRFLARYLLEKMPGKITLERVVKRRGRKLYLDYLQLWRGRTMPAPYSVRARPEATVSAPVTWEELAAGCLPADFTMLTVPQRIAKIGDLFRPLTTEKDRHQQELDPILAFVRQHMA